MLNIKLEESPGFRRMFRMLVLLCLALECATPLVLIIGIAWLVNNAFMVTWLYVGLLFPVSLFLLLSFFTSVVIPAFWAVSFLGTVLFQSNHVSVKQRVRAFFLLGTQLITALMAMPFLFGDSGFLRLVELQRFYLAPWLVCGLAATTMGCTALFFATHPPPPDKTSGPPAPPPPPPEPEDIQTTGAWDEAKNPKSKP